MHSQCIHLRHFVKLFHKLQFLNALNASFWKHIFSTVVRLAFSKIRILLVVISLEQMKKR